VVAILGLVAPSCTSDERRLASEVLHAGYTSKTYADPAHWLCRGDVDDDPCDSDMDATVIGADGTTTTERFTGVDDADVDCFYVYPTTSRDLGPNSDLTPAVDQEIFDVRHQAARFGSVCRVFAPVYRQKTLTAMIDRAFLGKPLSQDVLQRSAELAYADVVDAWKHYLANDNGGRGVVLIGHSQGANLLKRLIQDDQGDVRARLVSAMLLGVSVRVPADADVGGDFDHVPLCRANDDVGCVISYSSYRSSEPPGPNGVFGRVSDDNGVAACTNPGAFDGEWGRLRAYFPTAGYSVNNIGPIAWARGVAVKSPFVALPHFVTAKCVNRGGFSYLEVTVRAARKDARSDIIGDLRPSLGLLYPDWGLHLADVDLAMGNLIDLVRTQSEAWTPR
jgi:hypothetical protein